MARKERAIQVMDVTQSAGTTGITYPATSAGATYTNCVYIGDAILGGSGLSVWAVAEGGQTSANARLSLEQSFRLPEVEGSASPLFVTLQTLNITALNTWAYVALVSASTQFLTPYLRVRLTSTTTANAGTVTIKVLKQVEG